MINVSKNLSFLNWGRLNLYNTYKYIYLATVSNRFINNMAFFGITSLGPQNPFKSSLIDAIGLKVFTKEEFKTSFDEIDKDHSGYIERDEIEDLMRKTYGLDPLEIEVELFMQEFDSNHDGKISWQEFEESLDRIISDLENKAKKASLNKSHEELKFKRRKHIRSEINPHEVYIRPLTYGQNYGFFDFDKIRKQPTSALSTFYRSRCPETKYADDLIAGGHHFG
jgi:EF-hand domain pair